MRNSFVDVEVEARDNDHDGGGSDADEGLDLEGALPGAQVSLEQDGREEVPEHHAEWWRNQNQRHKDGLLRSTRKCVNENWFINY